MSGGWGDASGIEGNYEDDGEESTTAGETGSGSEANDVNSSTETNETSSSDETNKTKSTNSTKSVNIKEEWNGRTIYVPDDLLDDLESNYLETQLKLRKDGVNEFRKNRHFYPLLVQFGIEALEEADANQIQDRLSELSE